MKFEKILENLNIGPKQKAYINFYNYKGHKNINDYSSEKEYLLDSKTYFEDHEFNLIMQFRNYYEYQEYLVWKSIVSHMGHIDAAALSYHARLASHIQEHKCLIQKVINKKEIVDIENEKCFSYVLNKEVNATEILAQVGLTAFYYYSSVTLLLVMDELFDNFFSEMDIFESTKKLDIISKYNEGLDESLIDPVLENIKDIYKIMGNEFYSSVRINFYNLVLPLAPYKIVFTRNDDMYYFQKIYKKISERIIKKQREQI